MDIPRHGLWSIGHFGEGDAAKTRSDAVRYLVVGAARFQLRNAPLYCCGDRCDLLAQLLQHAIRVLVSFAANLTCLSQSAVFDIRSTPLRRSNQTMFADAFGGLRVSIAQDAFGLSV